MTGLEDLPETVDRIAAALESLGLQHAFGGAIAQNYWGVVRATQDIDVLALVPSLRYQDLANVLNAAGFATREPGGTTRAIEVQPMRHSMEKSGFAEIWRGHVKVELFVPILPFQRRVLDRAVRMPLGKREIPVTTAEDLIVLKMVFHRDKDLRDIRGILLSRRGQVDENLLVREAEQVLGADRLAELRRLLTDAKRAK